MDKRLVEKEEDETTSKRNHVAKSAREATKYVKKDKKEIGDQPNPRVSS